MKTEEQVRADYDRILPSYKKAIESGFCNHGNIGEVSGICSQIRGNIETLEWVLEIKDGFVLDYEAREEYDRERKELLKKDEK